MKILIFCLIVSFSISAKYLRIGDKVKIREGVLTIPMAMRGCESEGIIVDRVEPSTQKLNYRVKLDGCEELYWYSKKYLTKIKD